MKASRNTEILRKISKLATRWECTVTRVSRPFVSNALGEDDYHMSPTTSGCGLFWKGRSVVYVFPTSWAVVLHELGHIVACKNPPWGNFYATDRDEMGMLGWEYVVARRLGVSHREWLEAHGTYVFVGSRPFREISRKRQQTFINRRIQVSRNRGLIKNRLTPVPIR